MFKPVMHVKLSLLAAALALAGCTTVGPDYQRPTLELPSALGVPKTAAGNTLAQPEWQQWWKNLQDPVLTGLLEEALAHNQDLALAAARIAEARAASTVTHASRFPTVDATFGGNRSRVSTNSGKLPPGTEAVANDYQIGLSASYEADFWGKFSRADEASRARLLAQENNRGTVQSTLAANVVQTYLLLRAYDAQLALTETTLKTRQENQELVGKRVAAGSSGQLDLNLVQAETAAAAALAAQLRQSVANTESALAVLLGRSPQQIAQPVIARGASIDALHQQLRTPAELPSDLLQRRPDILAAEQTLVAANADIGQAKAQYFPSLRLTTGIGRESHVMSDLFSPASMLWNLAASVTQPVFRAGAVGALVRGSEARKEQALAQYVQTVQGAFRDVHDALISLSANDEVQAANRARVKALIDSRRLADLRYKSGYSNYQEVLNSERDLLQAQTNLVDSQRAELAALVGLYKALGGGWEAAPVAAS